MWKAQAGVTAQAGGGLSPGAGVMAGQAGPGGWHPTVLTMLALVVAEIVVVGLLSRHLLK